MDEAECRVLIKEYDNAKTQLANLTAYRDRFDAFNGFIYRAQCEKVQVSREKPSEKFIKLLLILKRPSRPILVIKIARYGQRPEQLDTIFWSEPKEFSDEGVLLAIKKPIGSVFLIRSSFKNADGAKCPTMFFANPAEDILSVRSRIQYFKNILDEKHDRYLAAKEKVAFGKVVDVDNPEAPEGSPSSL